MNRSKKFIMVFLAAAIFMASPAWAADDDVISVDFGSGFPIKETNLAPGQTITREFSIRNKTNDIQKGRIKLKFKSGDSALADRILISIRRTDGTLAELSPGKTQLSLAKADGTELKTGKIPGDETRRYEMIFAFDPLAGNEFQNKTYTFDIQVGADVDDVEEDDGDGGDGDGDGNGDDIGQAGDDNTFIDAMARAAGVLGETLGMSNTEAAENKDEAVVLPEDDSVSEAELTQVAGAESGCSGWPLWGWLTIFAAYAIAAAANIWQNYKKNEYHWRSDLFLLVVLVIAWYFLDNCRLYLWVPMYGTLFMILAHFNYLWLLRRKVKQEFPIE